MINAVAFIELNVSSSEARRDLMRRLTISFTLLEEMIMPGLVCLCMFFDIAPSQVSTTSLDWAKSQSSRTLQSVRRKEIPET